MLFPHFHIPSNPHSLANIRKSEIRSDNAFSRWAVIRSFDGGIVEVSIITVVLGGSDMAFSIICRAALCIWRSEIEERTVEVRSEV